MNTLAVIGIAIVIGVFATLAILRVARTEKEDKFGDSGEA